MREAAGALTARASGAVGPTGRPAAGVTAGAAVLVLILGTAGPTAAQTTRTGPTLRHGSGLLDVPVASVLPGGALRVNYSGFWPAHESGSQIEGDGGLLPGSRADESWRGDLSLAYGLWDLFEFGANLQSVASEADGGVLGGAFGRLVLLNSARGGLGLAMGARWANGPDFGDGLERSPTRLGVSDERALSSATADGLDTGWTGYAVASVELPGPRKRFLPDHDWTLTGGWGTGMFSDGGDLDWYALTDSGGWFAGLALHLAVDSGSVVTVETDFNGFDWNAGVEVDVRGVRVGGHLLGANHSSDATLYRSRKFGLAVSVDVCGAGLCRPKLMDRPTGEIVVLPAPPPDTLVVRETPPPLPEGEAVELCLATGTPTRVLVTAAGDTLVGDPPRPIAELRPAFDWAGDYAGGRAWFDAGEALDHDGRQYTPVRGLLRLSCDAIEPVGEHMGIDLFGMRGTDPPAVTVYVPVRPGVWKAYQVADPGMSPPPPGF